jgi:hypothetical protein
MTRHPTLEQLRAASNARDASARVASHLHDCPPCRDAVAAIREITIAARQEFNPAPPMALFEHVVRRRAEGERLILPVHVEPRPSIRRGHATRRGVLWATALLLGVAGAAAAFPGSPVRAWIASRLTPPVAGGERVAPLVAAPAGAQLDTAISEVSVPLIAGEGWVEMITRSLPTDIRLRVTDGVDLDVRGIGPASRAVFRPKAGGVGVGSELGGMVQIDIPRTAKRFVLRIGGVPHVIAESGRFRVLSPAADTTGADILVVARP